MFALRAMNTEVLVTALRRDEEAVARKVAATFGEAERRFSRFRPDSELSRLNRARGPVVVSRELFDVLRRARSYVEMTGGVFDPCVGGSLAALGYDRSFSAGALDRAAVPITPPAGSFLDVVLDEGSRVVERPEHLHIDLGGMVKGATVDRAATHLDGRGTIDAGGDAVMCGRCPTGGDWLVDIEDPSDPARTVATIGVSGGSVATSAANRRVWRAGDELAHHLIDPRTGRSARTDLLQVTVFAPRTELADVLAKTVFVLGALEGRRFLERQRGVGAVLVPRRGAPLFFGALSIREVSHA